MYKEDLEIEEITKEGEEIAETEKGNVEQPADEPKEKTYTQAQVEEIVGKRVRRNEAKIHREYQEKYDPLLNVLKAGTGEETVEGITKTLQGFYKEKGVEIPSEAKYSDRDIKILAKAEADDIIQSGN